jgi:phenylpyruvate tautomerase PptA (4-oxalocrotonate tautomerase family)
MPFVRLETSLDLSAMRRQSVLRAIITCTARALAVPESACRAAYVHIERSDVIIAAANAEPWVMAYAHIKAGRTPAIKATFTHALFDLLAAQLDVPRGALRILITDYAPEDWNNGGDVAATPD